MISCFKENLLKLYPKTSQVWFGEHERMISTPILALAPLFGSILGQGLSPLIVKDDPTKVPFLNIYVIIFVALGAASSWIFLDRASNY
jgi:hypothetical protein